MSDFKDRWNECYYNAAEEAREAGLSPEEAEAAGLASADSLVNKYLDAADSLRKRAKGE